MSKSKLLIATFFAAYSTFSVNAQAEDILSILERNSKMPPTAAPETIPYIYTVEINVFGKDGVVQADEEADDEVSVDEAESDLKDDKKKDKPKAENYSAVIEVNPTLTGEDRVTIISRTGDIDDESFQDTLEDFTGEDVSASDLAKDFWCDNNRDPDEEQLSAENITVISETDTEALVKPDLAKMAEILVDSNGDEEASKGQKKLVRRMLKRLDAEMTLSKPDGKLKDMKIWMTRSMRVALIAKIKDMNLHVTCEVAPNGFSYKSQQNFGMNISALGSKVEQNVHRRITNLRPLP